MGIQAVTNPEPVLGALAKFEEMVFQKALPDMMRDTKDDFQRILTLLNRKKDVKR